MAGLLVVPIRLDAFIPATDIDVVGPTVRFTRLPHRDAAGRDQNPDLPYVSETLLTAPFQDEDFRLKAGVHLHWSLPDALTRLVQADDGTTRIPAVPNRWLVTRLDKYAIQDQWVIESDYLSDVNMAAVAYPVTGPAGKPYRYLGRRVPLKLWSRNPDQTAYLQQLTAVGYGEPTFAAHYPNCHSIFGCYDPSSTANPPDGLRYEVIGWYDNLAKDPVTGLKADWQDVLKEQFGWGASSKTVPTRTVCYANLAFTGKTPPRPLPAAGTGVWIGNTPTEALAAHLGAVLPNVEPAEAENLLEALSYAERLEAKPLDLTASLMAARHANTFRDVPFGTLWTIRRQDDNAGVTAKEKQLREKLAVPHPLSDKLCELNAAQQDVDRAGHDQRALRRQLFADWYKYQLCAYPYDRTRDSYPDQDEVLFFLQRKMEYLAQEAARATAKDDALKTARQAVVSALAELNAAAKPARAAFVLQQVPAPAFQLPNEPVVLLTGSAAIPTERHGQDGAGQPGRVMACAVAPRDFPVVGTADDVRSLRSDVAAAAQAAGIGSDTWDPADWHPITLEWEVEFYPANEGNNLDPADRRYHPDFVTANYTLPARGVELKPATSYLPDKAANVYAGSTLVSAAARPVLSRRILTYLQGTLLPLYLAAKQPPVAPDAFAANPAAVLAWFDAHGTDTRLKLLIQMYRHLAANEDSNLSAALSGFNDALLMRKLTRQLPVADPLGFQPYQQFADTVRQAVADENRYAPQPLSDFNPIRAGAMRVLRLRIVGNFGITLDIDVSKIGTTTELTVPGHPGWVAMPPRIAQPARLTINWIDADSDSQENGLPDTSPICGWLVPDNLDLSLAVYAADGSAIGSLRALADPRQPQLAQWRPPPGGTLKPVANAHLNAVVQNLRTGGPAALGAMLTGLDDTLAQIEPEDYAQHQGRAVLMGSPIAVVRAEVTLELMGWPAVHQDWNVLRQDMQRSSRETNDFQLVRFPIRIGEHTLLDDGVLGFWLEDSAQQLTGAFNDVRSDKNPLVQALDLPSQYLTMLIDPRGKVHATIGILPTAELSVPAEMYRNALTRMAVGFFTGPLLADSGKVAVPLPNEPGFAWSWQERGRTGLTTLSPPPAPDQHVPAEPTLHEGWLILTPTTPAGEA